MYSAAVDFMRLFPSSSSKWQKAASSDVKRSRDLFVQVAQGQRLVLPGERVSWFDTVYSLSLTIGKCVQTNILIDRKRVLKRKVFI